jgi:diphthine synthase
MISFGFPSEKTISKSHKGPGKFTSAEKDRGISRFFPSSEEKILCPLDNQSYFVISVKTACTFLFGTSKCRITFMMCRRLAPFTMTEERLSAGLWLIGLGPGNLDYMSKAAIDVGKACSHRFLEGYTAILPSDQEVRLESFIGNWERIMRPQVEDPKELLKLAKEVPVALLIVGDPMQATTHIDLEARCDELGINFNVIPGITATALAVSLSGLQSYRFGRQVTIPYSYGNYLPSSPLEMIYRNYENNLHTLVLLDLDPTGMGVEKPTPMSPIDAFRILQKMEEKMEDEGNNLCPQVKALDGVLLTDISLDSQKIIAGNLSEITECNDGWIHCLIIPSKMNQNEIDAFERRKIV